MNPTAILLLHGWCCHAGFWREQLAALAPGGDVVALELGGAPPAIADLADHVAETARRLPNEAVALVGHSMGGAVALEAAIRLGARCRLVLGVDTFTDAAFYAARPAPEIEARLRPFAEDFTGAMAGMVARIVAPRSGAGLARWIAGEMSGAAPTQALLALRSLLEWDIAARWPLLACPVETINSAWLDAAAQPAAGLPGLVTHAMAGVGHFPMLEAPARFNALARSILERHRPGLGAA